MALDDRDWYVDELRKKQGHKEPAACRKPGPPPHQVMRRQMQRLNRQPSKPRRPFRWKLFWWALFFVELVVLFYLKRKH